MVDGRSQVGKDPNCLGLARPVLDTSPRPQSGGQGVPVRTKARIALWSELWRRYLAPGACFFPSQVPLSVSLVHLPESSPFFSFPVSW